MGVRPEILLVEADKDWVELLRNLLKNYDLTLAASAEEALDMLDSKQFQAIVINLQLPDHNGIELLNERVSHQDLLDIPVIVYGPWPELGQVSQEAWQAYNVSGWMRQTNLVKELPIKLKEVL